MKAINHPPLSPLPSREGRLIFSPSDELLSIFLPLGWGRVREREEGGRNNPSILTIFFEMFAIKERTRMEGVLPTFPPS